MKESSKSAYGELVSLKDTKLVDSQDSLEDIGTVVTADYGSEQGSLLYEYQKTGRINGIPVAAEAAGLDIPSDQVLLSAFILKARPRLFVGCLNPAAQGDSKDQYDKILDMVYDGRARIVEESKQYDVTAGGFVVWVRYDELEYALHPRYEYLRS